MATRLIADIGGTNARLALASPAGVTEAAKLPVGVYATLDAALDAYLAARPGAQITSIAIAAAGPRDGDAIVLTNAPWRIEGPALSRRFGGAPVRLLNDLEAVALCLPSLGPADLDVLAPGTPVRLPLPMLATNVGTGFGAAVAVPARGGWAALGTEAGHMSLAPAGPDEAALLGGALSVEDAFSGPGYARLLSAAAEEGGEAVRPMGAAAETGARRLYSRIFGRVLGDLALATGAWGGVYLTGGVVSDLHRVFDVEALLAAFRRKGKMATRVERIRVCRITADAPAFRYLATAEID